MKMKMTLIQVLRQLPDSELKTLVSLAQKEQRRRKAIKQSNDNWTCNAGLIHVLETSLSTKPAETR